MRAFVRVDEQLQLRIDPSTRLASYWMIGWPPSSVVAFASTPFVVCTARTVWALASVQLTVVGVCAWLDAATANIKPTKSVIRLSGTSPSALNQRKTHMHTRN